MPGAAMIRITSVVASVIVGLAIAGAPSAEAQVGSKPAPPRSSPGPRLPDRVFVDINGGFQSATETFSDSRQDPYFVETASWDADYEFKGGPLFDVGVGVRVWQGLVAAASYSRFSDTSVALVDGSVPHPFFFNRLRTFSGEATGLKQQDDVVHISGMWVAPVSRSIDVRIFGGPSMYSVKRDLIEDVNYQESGYPYDTAAFGSADVAHVDETAWGYHVGGDVTWMFTRNVGVGGIVRYSRAEKDLVSPADGATLSLGFGGLQYGGGLRFRFGAKPARRVDTPGPVKAAPVTPPTSTEAKPDTADTAVLRKDSGVFVRPGTKSPLRILPAGTRVKVREEAGEWLLVEFRDPQWGNRVGYVLRADCQY